MFTRRRSFSIAALAGCALAVAACGGSQQSDAGAAPPPPLLPPPPSASRAGQVTGVAETPGADLSAIAERLSGVLALNYNTANPDVLAKQLFGKGGAAAPADALFVLDTRESADFAAGHIPGAVNVPLQKLPQAMLDDPSIFPSKDIVVASYSGGDGNMAVLLLNAIRITDPAAQRAATAAKQPLPFKTAKGLFMGMTSWSYRTELAPRPSTGSYRFAGDANARPLEKAAVATANQQVPAFAAFETDDLSRKILVRAAEFLSSVPSQHDLQVDATAVAAQLANADPAARPQVLSVRSNADYLLWGHLPGAMNVPWQKVADLAKARVVDPRRPLVVYCYTGHTGARATMALGLLGYPARNLLYGMASWNMAASGGALRNFDLLKGWDFPLHDGIGGAPALLAYDPPRAGCVGCHSSLTAITYDLWATPAAVLTAPASEGEG